MFEHSVQLLGSGQYEKSALSIPAHTAQEHPLMCKVVYATLHGQGFMLAVMAPSPASQPKGSHQGWQVFVRRYAAPVRSSAARAALRG
ncbi:hypothetical protein GEV39_14110 [Pseudomonas sp. NY5710]|nr:hypothetical protein GEV39_14110 [Pseudomonas sp. NY5710]